MKNALFLFVAACTLSLGACSKDDSYSPSNTPGHQHPKDSDQAANVTKTPKRGGEKPTHVKEPEVAGSSSDTKKP